MGLRGEGAQGQKVLENRLRRTAERRGMTLEKIRRIDQKAIDYGRFKLTDVSGALVRFGPHDHGSAEEVEAYLNQ